ncbi:recombinase [Streptomyces aureoversilis]|uniref:Recombinase n=1 Tax=Streptomyces aureoversilis TaxID=67277 RepID=A0ABV9ZW83_9ACTN
MNPKMLPRLDELEKDLQARRQQAETEGWLGEIEGTDLTLQFLHEKREQDARSEQPGRSVALGMPSVPARP